MEFLEIRFQKISLAIVMEYCSGGSISDIYRCRKQTLTEEACATIIRDTLFGLDYLHQQRKIHRDVKCGNILLTGSAAINFSKKT